MEAERKRPKGSFFNLFDWNGKSRKKLFANNSESLEGSVEGKEKGETRTKSCYVVMEVNDRRAFNHDANNYSCASSVTSDEGYYASRPPGVVAKLMGLDSLPTSSIHEPSATLFSNSQPLKVSPYDTTVPHLWSENNPMVFYSRHDACSWECMKPRPHKLQSRPIERFQMEMLPPKSAKTIPVTHHKLLSPIRNPGSMTRENVSYVMEAAAKIMDASPRATNSKMPSITSSIPVRIRDLKQKMEAAHAASVVQRNSIFGSSQGSQHQSLNGSEGMRSSRVPVPSPKGTSDGARRKGVSASTVTGSKASEQRREGSPSRHIGNMKEKGRNEVKSNVISRRPPASEKSVAKRASGRDTGNVLQQNNHKQNVTLSKDGPTSKLVRKVQTTNVSGVHSRTMNKTAYRPEMGSRKMVAGSAKEKLNSISQKKRSGVTCLAVDTNSSGIVSFNKDGRAIKCTIAMDCSNNVPQHNMKNNMDVVSFTFSSPIKSNPSSQFSSPSLELLGDQDTCFKNLSSLPMGYVAGADALGSLLEQKLKELTERVQSSNYTFIREKTSAKADASPALSLDISRTRPMENRRLFQSSLDASTSDQLDQSECFLATKSSGSVPQKWEQTESEEMEEHSSSSDYSEAGKECLGPSPVSILEPLYKSGNRSKAQSFKLSSVAQEVHNPIFDGESLDVDETEASDSVSLISAADVGISRLAEACTFSEDQESGDSEMNYLKGMLSNAHLILEEFASGRTSKVMEYHLFDWLENRENEPGRHAVEYSKLEQKLLFDCAIEWLDSACARVSLGGCKTWSRLWILFQKEGWAVEKLSEEMQCWRSMESMMVDEIVDKDMSSQYGKWIDFNQEAFEEGVEIENDILTSLVDELLSDLLPL